MHLWLIIIILGLVEGLTEFIPVSSTGHLIIANEILGFQEKLGTKELVDIFDVVIQLGAIFAIGLLYREKLVRAFWSPVEYLLAMLRKDKHVKDPGLENEPLLAGDRLLFFNLMLGTIPAAVIGLVLHHFVEDHLFNSLTVAIALILGGFAIFLIEKKAPAPTATNTSAIRPWQALAVGFAQVLSLVPGTSRSGATIMGGLCAKLNRQVATEFSFLLSFPIMCMATAFSLLKDVDKITPDYIIVLLLGAGTAFVSAYIVVKWLIRFVQNHSFKPFAWYRIILGIIVLGLHYSGFFKHMTDTPEAPAAANTTAPTAAP